MLEVVETPLPYGSVARRAANSVAALNGVLAAVEQKGPAELGDPLFQDVVKLKYGALSNALIQLRIYDAQLALLRMYVRLFADDVTGWRRLGDTYRVLSSPHHAASCYARALALTPEDTALRARLAWTLVAAARPAAAAAVAAPLGGGEGDYLRGVIYRELGDFRRARAAFAAAAPQYENDGAFWLDVGKNYDALGDYAGAAAAFTKGLAAEPGAAWLYTARGVVYLKLEEPERAAADFATAVALDGRDGLAHYNLACLHARGGRAADALRHLAAALAVYARRFGALARDDPDFAPYRASPAFRRVMAAAEPSRFNKSVGEE